MNLSADKIVHNCEKLKMDLQLFYLRKKGIFRFSSEFIFYCKLLKKMYALTDGNQRNRLHMMKLNNFCVANGW